jgi:hypothetical protein
MSYTNEPRAYRNEPGVNRDEAEVYNNNPNYRVTETSTTTAPGAMVPRTEYHDLVRWGPIIAGLVVAIATQLILTGFGAAVGLTTLANVDTPQTAAGDIGTAVGIWSIISLLISLFLGGWIMARACGPMNRNIALLNGAILWGTTLAISSWLVSAGVTGAFGLVAQTADAVVNQLPPDTIPGVGTTPGTTPGTGQPNVTAQQVQRAAGNAATVGWTFALCALLGLAAAVGGAAVGARNPRPYNVTN